MAEIPNDWRITLKQFANFLTMVGRSSKCPICPHEGDWNFYIDDTHTRGEESYMLVTMMNVITADGAPDTAGHHGCFSMECPRCGNLVYTSTPVVIATLARGGIKNG